MIDFASHRQKIREAQAQLDATTDYRRRRDLKKYIGRLHKELSEAEKYHRAATATKG